MSKAVLDSGSVLFQSPSLNQIITLAKWHYMIGSNGNGGTSTLIVSSFFSTLSVCDFKGLILCKSFKM